MVDKGLLAQCNYTRLYFLSVNLIAKSDSFKTRHILGSYDVVALAAGINTNLVVDQWQHRLECRAVGGHNNDVLVRPESAIDHRKLG